MLQRSDRCVFGEDREDVEAKGGGEFEAGKEENSIQQASILAQEPGLVGFDPTERLEEFEVFNLTPHPYVAAHTVVIREREDVDVAFLCSLEKLDKAKVALLVIRRRWSVDVEVHFPPLEVRVIGLFRGMWARTSTSNQGWYWSPPLR